ncbi:heparinase II/III family protein [Kocuria sp. M1R5S2]|uniref:heparinase II/III family protein n=1 Tax=Kocuria rhizosphaerae TaxID=3376285 RepID=UPI0037A7CEC4
MSAARTEIAAQHMLGGLFRARGNDRHVADDLLNGTLRLDNHPAAAIDLAAPDWHANPFRDNNWQFSYHSLRWIDVLRRTYDATGEQQYLDAYTAVARSWHETHTADPTAKVSRFAWYDMGAGLRVLILAGVLHTIGEDEWIVDCIAEHGRRMAPEDFGHQIGNHIIHIHNGLITAGHIMGEPTWTEMATHRLKKLLLENVDLKGVADDGAIQYQINNYNWYKEALDHARAAGIHHGPEFDRVDLMPEFLAHAFQTNRVLVQFGDSDRTAVPRLSVPVLDYINSKGESGQRPDELYKVYEHAGYAFGRTHWDVEDMTDVLHYSLRFGPAQNAHTHAHQDGGSVTINYGGVELHPEGGRYRYDTQPMSIYFKSQSTHNTVTFLADEFDPDAPTDLVSSWSSDRYETTVVRREERQGSVWQRAVVHDRPGRGIVVADHVRPHTHSETVQLWQLPAGAIVRTDDRNALIYLRGKHLATLAVAASAPLYFEVVEGRRSADHIEGWRSVKYGECFEAPVLRIGVRAAEALIATSILPNLPNYPGAVLNRGERTSASSLCLGIERAASSATVRFRVVDGLLTANIAQEGAGA